jgi:hypothetical protein
MGFSTSGAMSGAAAGSSFSPWGAGIGALAGGFFGGGSSAGAPPPPPKIADPKTPGSVIGQYGSSYIDPVTGQVNYGGTSGNLSKTSLLNQNLQSQLMGYGGNQDQINGLIKQQQQKLSGYQPTQTSSFGNMITGMGQGFNGGAWQGSGVPGALHSLQPGGTYDALTQDRLTQLAPFGIMGSNEADNTTYRNMLGTLQSNDQAKNAQSLDAQNYLDTLNAAKQQAGEPNPILSYLNHGPDNLNYLQGNVQKQFQNAELANRAQNAARGMGNSSMSEIGGAANAQNLALGIQGAQSAAGQQNFNNRNTMLNYLSGQNAQDLQAEGMRGGLNMQQMGQGQNVGLQMANAQTSKDAAQAGLNFQGSMAGFNANQANNMQNQNNFNSAMGAVGNAAGQYNSNQMMQNWLNNQNNMRDPNGGASDAYNQWMAQNAGRVAYD